MLSKEEIENLLKNIAQGFRKIPQVENILYPLDINQFQKLSEYIQQLETKEQKLIEKLEEDIEITKKQYSDNSLLNIRVDGKLDTLEEILEIVKGENDE